MSEIYSLMKTRLPSFIPINRSRFHVRRGEKWNAKLVENQPSLLSFPATGPFSSLSLRCGLQPPPPSSPIFSPSSLPQVAIKPSHMVVAPLLSLLCKTLLFFHRNPSSSNNSNHLAQKLLSFPTEARAATRSSATPTVPTASFPSPLQTSASSPSSCNQSQSLASPPPVAPCATSQAVSSLNAR